MSKAILIMDMPSSCDKCLMFGSHYSDLTCKVNGRGIDYPYPKDFRQRWCPLKELPSKKDYDNMCDPIQVLTYKDGWNECLDKILKQ